LSNSAYRTTLMVPARASVKWISIRKLPCFISWNVPTSDISGVRSNPNKVFACRIWQRDRNR
jgi:hypothetical protein